MIDNITEMTDNRRTINKKKLYERINVLDKNSEKEDNYTATKTIVKHILQQFFVESNFKIETLTIKTTDPYPRIEHHNHLNHINVVFKLGSDLEFTFYKNNTQFKYFRLDLPSKIAMLITQYDFKFCLIDENTDRQTKTFDELLTYILDLVRNEY